MIKKYIKVAPYWNVNAYEDTETSIYSRIKVAPYWNVNIDEEFKELKREALK